MHQLCISFSTRRLQLSAPTASKNSKPKSAQVLGAGGHAHTVTGVTWQPEATPSPFVSEDLGIPFGL